MIDINEFSKEQIHIADLMVSTIQGENPEIPYFKYHGPCTERDKIMIGKHGIYVFTVFQDVMLSTEMAQRYNCALNNNGSGAGATFRHLYPDKLKVGDVFYLGKVSSKTSSIYQRLRVHFGGASNTSTSGIKMQMPERNFLIGNLVVHTFLLDNEFKQNSKIIVDPIEKLLFSKLNPLAGYR